MTQPKSVRLVTEQKFDTLITEAQDTKIMPISRGSITTPTNINAFVTTAHTGAWAGRAEMLLGLPAGIPADALVNLLVSRTSTNAIVHDIFVRGQRLWRSAATNNTMGEWVKIPDVPLVAENRYVVVDDGGIAYSINPLHSAYDFGGSWPAGMTRSPSDVAKGSWLKNPNLLGGRGVSHELGGSATILTYDDAGIFGDGEVLVRCECSTVGSSAGSGTVFRASSSGSGISGYQVWAATSAAIGGTALGLSSLNAGASATVLDRAAFPGLAANKPFFIRINVAGPTIKVKAWNDGTVEPPWMIDLHDEKHASGHTGFYASTSAFAWDVLSVNRGGGSAA